MAKKQFGVRIDEKLLNDWNNFCSRYGLKMADHVGKALKDYMKWYEKMVEAADGKFLKKNF